MKYITYMLLDSEGIPFYVGAGKPSRPLKHFTKSGGGRPLVHNIISEHRRKGLEVTHIVTGEFDDKDDAFSAEVLLISLIGKVSDGGTLVNTCDGGKGIKGFKFSEEHRAMNSVRQIERFSDMSERVKISTRTRAAMANTDLRRHISTKLKDKWRDDDYRIKQTIAHTGKKDTNETRLKKSQSQSRAWNTGHRQGKYSDEIIADIYSKKGNTSVHDVAALYDMNPTYVHKIWRHERCVTALKRLGVL